MIEQLDRLVEFRELGEISEFDFQIAALRCIEKITKTICESIIETPLSRYLELKNSKIATQILSSTEAERVQTPSDWLDAKEFDELKLAQSLLQDSTDNFIVAPNAQAVERADYATRRFFNVIIRILDLGVERIRLSDTLSEVVKMNDSVLNLQWGGMSKIDKLHLASIIEYRQNIQTIQNRLFDIDGDSELVVAIA